MGVTICGRFCPDESVVAGYGNRIQTKYTAMCTQILNCVVIIAGLIFFQNINGAKSIIYSEKQYFIVSV